MSDVDSRKGGEGAASELQWMKEMVEHFNKTGSYRADDVARVLGDQTVSVEAKTEDTLPLAAKIERA